MPSAWPESSRPLGVGQEEIHGEVDAFQLAARGVADEVVGLGGAGADHHRVELPLQVVGGHVLADLHPGDELDALGLHLVETPPDDLFLVELHVGNAVHEQAAGPVRPLVDGDVVAGPVELRRAGQAGRTGADDRHTLSRPLEGRLGDDPAFLETPIDDGAFDGLDGDRIAVDAQDAGTFAGSRAHPAGELGEVVGLVKLRQGLLPVVPVNQVVPVGDEIVQRTARGPRSPPHGHARMTERNAAVHAAGALLPQRLLRHGQDELVPVLQAFERVAVGLLAPLIFHESGDLPHNNPGTSPAGHPLSFSLLRAVRWCFPPAQAGADAAVPEASAIRD